MRETGPVRLRLQGVSAKKYISLGRKFLGQMKKRMKAFGSLQQRWRRTLPDGTTIEVGSIFGQDFIRIISSLIEKGFNNLYFICKPVSDDCTSGWGLPEVDPIGTCGGSNNRVLIEPFELGVLRYIPDSAENIDWQGQDRDFLTYRGYEGRHFYNRPSIVGGIYTTLNKIYDRFGQLLETTTYGVRGAAYIYGNNGSKTLVYATHNGGKIEFYVKNPTWTKIGDVECTYTGAKVFFSPDGKKAKIIDLNTTNGGEITVNLSETSVSSSKIDFNNEYDKDTIQIDNIEWSTAGLYDCGYDTYAESGVITMDRGWSWDFTIDTDPKTYYYNSEIIDGGWEYWSYIDETYTPNSGLSHHYYQSMTEEISGTNRKWYPSDWTTDVYLRTFEQSTTSSIGTVYLDVTFPWGVERVIDLSYNLETILQGEEPDTWSGWLATGTIVNFISKTGTWSAKYKLIEWYRGTNQRVICDITDTMVDLEESNGRATITRNVTYTYKSGGSDIILGSESRTGLIIMAGGDTILERFVPGMPNGWYSYGNPGTTGTSTVNTLVPAIVNRSWSEWDIVRRHIINKDASEGGWSYPWWPGLAVYEYQPTTYLLEQYGTPYFVYTNSSTEDDYEYLHINDQPIGAEYDLNGNEVYVKIDLQEDYSRVDSGSVKTEYFWYQPLEDKYKKVISTSSVNSSDKRSCNLYDSFGDIFNTSYSKTSNTSSQGVTITYMNSTYLNDSYSIYDNSYDNEDGDPSPKFSLIESDPRIGASTYIDESGSTNIVYYRINGSENSEDMGIKPNDHILTDIYSLNSPNIIGSDPNFIYFPYIRQNKDGDEIVDVSASSIISHPTSSPANYHLTTFDLTPYETTGYTWNKLNSNNYDINPKDLLSIPGENEKLIPTGIRYYPE